MGVGTLPKSQLQVVRNFWRESMTGVCVCVLRPVTHGMWVVSGDQRSPSVGTASPGDRDSSESVYLCTPTWSHKWDHQCQCPCSQPCNERAVYYRPVCMHALLCVCVMVTPLTWLGQLAVILTEETDGDDPESEDVSDIVCVTNVITMFCFVSSVSIHSYCQGSLPISELVLS